MPHTVCTDELSCAAAGVALLASAIDQAFGDLPDENWSDGWVRVAEDELRSDLPGLLAELPIEAGLLFKDYVSHLEELVAFFCRLERKVGTSQ
jgi:hypothetical protein